MDCCSDPRDRHFGEKHAVRDLKRYKRKGPDGTTVHILEEVRSLDLQDASLLDIGSGIGIIHHELLEDVCREAIHVDLSTAYVQAAREETNRRGHEGRVRFVVGDFASEEVSVSPADVVTLDRVVCCYPDFSRLLKRSAEKAARVLAFSYPRDRWITRAFLALSNYKRVLTGDPFRAYIHSVDDMEHYVEENGFRLVSQRQSLAWRTSVYRRQEMG